MASSEKVYYSLLPIEDTINERGLVLFVRENYFDANVDLVEGTELADFMSEKEIEKSSALDSFGGYQYRKQLDKQGNMLRFLFLAPKSREVIQTPFKTYYETEPSMFWPKVLLSIRTSKRLSEGTYICRPRYKEAYQGPTRVRVEEFYSPTPFEIPLYEPMMERGLREEIGIDVSGFWYSVGVLELDSCLHYLIDLSVVLDPPIELSYGGSSSVIYSFASVYEPATNYTDWPDELVIDDRQREVIGGFIRRKVTALRPMIIRVTAPTSASIMSTSATLGGTISILDSAVVSSRGVVFAKTSLDANPEVGNTHASQVSTTGTTGVFTVNVTGLTSATNYTFKPWALSSQGVRVYGPAGTFTTA